MEGKKLLKKCCPGNYQGAGSNSLAVWFNGNANISGVISSYNQIHPACTIEEEFTYNAIGSGAGLSLLLSGQLLFSATDLPPTDSDVASVPIGSGKLLTFPILLYGVAIIYNINNQITTINLDANIIANIYNNPNGVYWDDKAITAINKGINFPHELIIPVARADKTCNTGELTNWLQRFAKGYSTPPVKGGSINGPFVPPGPAGTVYANPAVIGATGAAGMYNKVSTTPNAIGYIGYEYLVTNNLLVPTARLLNTFSNKYIEISTATILANIPKNYEPPDDLRINLIKTSTAPKGYPLANFTSICTISVQPSKCIVKNLQQFLQYLLTTGQLQALKLGFVPIPKKYLCLDYQQLLEIIDNETYINRLCS